MKTMVVFIEKGGVSKGQKGVEGAAFLPPTSCLTCMPAMPCPPLLKKRQKKSAESGLGTQCRPALCFKILVPAGTRIK
jgi:hypothetical protein